MLKLIAFLLPLHLFSAELPEYSIIKEALEGSEIAQLQQITEEIQPEYLWYGRHNFWREVFEANQNEAEDPVFTHSSEHPVNAVTDKLSRLFLTKIKQFGVDLTNKKIFLESYLDRNVVTHESAPTSGMFWHRDSISVEGEKKMADFSIILLINGQVQDWEGADLVLQLGGEYSQQGSYEWINSALPKVCLKPRYNQAIIFRNSNTGHMVTPVIPLTGAPVHRDVFIITCYLN